MTFSDAPQDTETPATGPETMREDRNARNEAIRQTATNLAVEARVQDVNNGIIAAHDAELRSGENAFLSRTGAAAITSAPAVLEKLDALKTATLAREDIGPQVRVRLAPILDAHLASARETVMRHAVEQQTVYEPGVAQRAIDLSRQQASLDYGDPDKIGLVVLRADSAARALNDGAPTEKVEAEAAKARASVLASALTARVAADPRGAVAMYDTVKAGLDPEDARRLDATLASARTSVKADDWIAANKGDDAVSRAESDPSLSPAERMTVVTRLQNAQAAAEAARTARIASLDDSMETTSRALMTTGSREARGQMAVLAAGYESAGDTPKAERARLLATNEDLLRSFAQTSAATQQRLLAQYASKPVGAVLAETHQRQTEAFARDAFAAGTALYPDVGPPATDIPGRVRQADLISHYRGGAPVIPLTVQEIATLRRKLDDATPDAQAALLTGFADLPERMLPAFAQSLAGKDPISQSYAVAFSMIAAKTPEAEVTAIQILQGTRLIQEAGAAGKPSLVSTSEWQTALDQRLDAIFAGAAPDDTARARAAIAAVYTYNLTRAGQQAEGVNDRTLNAAFTAVLGIDPGRTVLDAGPIQAQFNPEGHEARAARGELGKTLRSFETIEGRLPATADIDLIAGETMSNASKSTIASPRTEMDHNGRGGPYTAVEILKILRNPPQGRGTSVNTEPPSNDPEFTKALEAWPGRKVILPDGSAIPDRYSATGYLMSPFDDLNSVALEGRK